MVNGFSLGAGIFCFILMVCCLVLGYKEDSKISLGCGIINGIIGIINFWMAF